ncbi:MAG: N-acetylmuramoyl-L-alanine amidase [Gemmatimonadota bacterium]|nr:N-acetylmuramoyl-L-alanine amidase [Gemmatimonadota bacterium]MDH4348901.1 N-acetylmuramoyl-L-alanine amidase [Gemmatimonadota bacterium]MDH5283856.1 N-acetylmuramoyl-L-alanine amidase [Gemmatimonadota bacterium]
MTSWRQVLPLAVALAAAAPASLEARAPVSITIVTPRGTARVPVTRDRHAGLLVPGGPLIRALAGTIRPGSPWVEVVVSRQSFRFLIGAPVFALNDRLEPLAGWATFVGDSLYLPLQFVTEVLPRVVAERFAWNPGQGSLVEGPPAARRQPVDTVERLPNGLLPGHVVTVDAGHGGVDPGNLGIYFPRGVNEKHVTLQMATLVQAELKRQGVRVVMTRTRDTLINLADRAGYCAQDCSLFVSLHVDALDARARKRYGEVRGFHTIIIGEENSEDADRVAAMENDALRYEVPRENESADGLDFILRNLQRNEYLRESARAAELVQASIDRVHTGENRGVRQSNILAVLNTARRPAILVEMGYSSNREDARLLLNRNSQKAIAAAIAEAVVSYLREYERRGGSPTAKAIR